MPKRNPWDRLPGETEESYAAFVAYRDLGRKRSLDAVHAATGRGGKPGGDKRPPTYLERWSSRHRWVERARAFDDHRQAVVDAERVKAWRRWERRRLAALDATYEDAQIIRAKARDMMRQPVRKMVSEDGKTVVSATNPNVFYRAADMLLKAAQIEAAATGAAGMDPPDDLDPYAAEADPDDREPAP